jgi:hypothetical protein
MPYEAYKVLHVLGILFLFVALGGVALHAWNGGTKQTNQGRRAVSAMHGLGLFLILLAGFGMLARLGMVQGGLPGWVLAKLVLWLVIGGLFLMPYRRPGTAKPLFFLVPLLGALAAVLAIYKPF